MTAPADPSAGSISVSDTTAPRLCIPQINPSTGLSTDYLNHFSEAIMALKMMPAMHDCLDDLRAWRPKSYREHFAASHFRDRHAVIAAYEGADPAVRKALDSASATLNAVLSATRDVVLRDLAAPDAAVLAQRALARLNPLIARATALINGTPTGTGADSKNTQAAIDALFDR